MHSMVSKYQFFIIKQNDKLKESIQLDNIHNIKLQYNMLVQHVHFLI